MLQSGYLMMFVYTVLMLGKVNYVEVKCLFANYDRTALLTLDGMECLY